MSNRHRIARRPLSLSTFSFK